MDFCFKCGVSGEKTLLFDVISDKGIIKLCRQCVQEEDFPLLRADSEAKQPEPSPRLQVPEKLEMSEGSKRMYERLVRISGVRMREKKSEEEQKKLDGEQEELRQITNKNFEERFEKDKGDANLIDNFHWIIMRARRAKHLTQEQLAEAIREPLVAIQRAEEGFLPKDNLLIKKIEDFLGIRILKEQPRQNYFENKNIEFDETISKELTISDLQEMKKQRGAQEEENKEKTEEKEDLSDKDIDDILFGRR